MRTTTTLLLPVALVIGFVLIPDRANACTCVPYPPDQTETEEERLQQTLEAAGEIFQGRVVAHRSWLDGWCDPEEEPPDEQWALVEVSRVWRGAIGPQVVLTTDVSSCKSLPTVGEELLFVFSSREPGAPRYTGYCSRYSFPVEVAVERAEVLGEPYDPSPDVEESLPVCPSEPDDAEGCASSSSSSVALPVLLLALLLLRGRRARPVV